MKIIYKALFDWIQVLIDSGIYENEEEIFKAILSKEDVLINHLRNKN